MVKRLLAMTACTLTVVLGAGMVWAQDYPTKPIRIVAGNVGGGSDFQARTIAQGLTTAWGQPVTIVNSASNTAGITASRSAPDGYTLLVNGASLWTLPLIRETPYDMQKDFVPISLVERSPNFLVVHPTLPAKTVKDLIAVAKARPGQLNAGTGSAETVVALEMFKVATKTNITSIPYSNNSIKHADLVAGEIQITFSSTAPVVSYIKAGRLRVLAVTTPVSSTLFPEYPTVAATVPGFDASAKSALFAPAGTPPAIVTKLNQEVVRLLNTPAAKEKFATIGAEAVASTPAELAAIVKSETAQISKLIKDAGIKLN